MSESPSSVTAALESDLRQIARQEARLQFVSFGADTAWRLGNRLRDIAISRGAAVAVDIQVGGLPLMGFALQGVTACNLDWVRRKRNVVNLMHRSSYAVGLELQVKGRTLTQECGVDPRDYAVHGGAFPIRLCETGWVGSVTVSGLSQRDDHDLVVEGLADVLGLSLAELRLPPRGV